MDCLMVIDMKLFEDKCPQCNNKLLLYHNSDGERVTAIWSPHDEIRMLCTCAHCNHKFNIDCVPTWIINGEY